MKKTGLISVIAGATMLGALLLVRPLVASGTVIAAESERTSVTASPDAPETTPDSASIGAPETPTTSTEEGETTAPVSTQSVTSIQPPVTDEPIVQPKPEVVENSVFLTHSTPLRAGQEITFIFSCRGEDVRALQGSISYDDDLLTYKSVTTIDGGWLFTLNDVGGKLTYVGFSTETEGASGVSQLFSITFTLDEDAVTGNAIPFHVDDAAALKGTKELTFSGGACTFLVDRPISNECYLSDLIVGAGTLAPEFDSEVTDYRLQVPFDCRALELTATPCAYATVDFSDTTLEVGNNTLTVTVTAESGEQRVYTLTVTRASDPNYVPSTDSQLQAVTLSNGMLFPAFSPSITEYRIYVVNEGNITLTPTPADFGSAEVTVVSGEEGATCSITSYAEDGSTTVYTFTVLRVTLPDGVGNEQNRPGETLPNGSPAQAAGGTTIPMRMEYLLAILAASAVALFFVGFGVSSLVGKKKASAHSSEVPPTPSETSESPSETVETSETPSETSDSSSNEPK